MTPCIVLAALLTGALPGRALAYCEPPPFQPTLGANEIARCVRVVRRERPSIAITVQERIATFEPPLPLPLQATNCTTSPSRTFPGLTASITAGSSISVGLGAKVEEVTGSATLGASLSVSQTIRCSDVEVPFCDARRQTFVAEAWAPVTRTMSLEHVHRRCDIHDRTEFLAVLAWGIGPWETFDLLDAQDLAEWVIREERGPTITCPKPTVSYGSVTATGGCPPETRTPRPQNDPVCNTACANVPNPISCLPGFEPIGDEQNGLLAANCTSATGAALEQTVLTSSCGEWFFEDDQLVWYWSTCPSGGSVTVMVSDGENAVDCTFTTAREASCSEPYPVL